MNATLRFVACTDIPLTRCTKGRALDSVMAQKTPVGFVISGQLDNFRREA
jgi:hypothetical protein